MKYICNTCNEVYDENSHVWKCECGGYLLLKNDVVFTRKSIKTERMSMWRYDEAFPLKYEELKATYNEGMTPLVRVNSSKMNLKVKMDSLMPTGSFKDRGTVMVVNQLIKQGVNRITEDSSGNAGASVAGYCALAKMPCDIYVPKGNSLGKIIQIKSYGANIHEIEGTREDVALAAQKDSECYAGHNWHPMFVEGTKSLAFELWEQNGFRAPENIIAVAGNGSTILGIYYGFRCLQDNGQISQMPRLFVAQAEKCNPIYRRYKNMPLFDTYEKTIAEGIALAHPNKADQVVNAIMKTGGEMLSLHEDEILDATFELSTYGFFIEPTSATAFAGLKNLYSAQKLSSGDEVVMVVSGNGLKASSEIAELYERR